MKQLTKLALPLAFIAVFAMTTNDAEARMQGAHSLSDDQRQELKDLREDGAERSEIKEQLEKWGIDLDSHKSHKRKGFKKAISEQLSDDQRQELKDLREDGAERSEIKEQLEKWGIEIPEPPFFDQLSDSQKESFKELKEQGAERSEIKEQLQEWGVEMKSQRKNS